MKQTMRLNVSQRLTLTPALQQAIRMLQLSTVDLKTEIQDKLESNFMLEVEEPEPINANRDAAAANTRDAGDASTDHIPDNLPLDTHWNDIYANNSAAPTAQRGGDQDWRQYQQDNLTATPSLQAHLAWQADMHPFSPQQRDAASHIIDAIDDNGFITDWPELCGSLEHAFGLSEIDAETILHGIHQFDPAGVGARGVAECLAIQLHQLDAATPGHGTALTLVEGGYLGRLAEGRPEALARAIGVSPQELACAHALLQTLQPYPGSDYTQTRVDYIIPEVFVTRRQGSWTCQLNPDIAPQLRINSHYLGLLDSSAGSQDRAALKSHLQEARSFLHGLKSRNQTLLQVAQCIVEAQCDFLDYGEEAMKPLVLRDVSNLLDIHESTVSRATANKFMQTPRGIFELKYFFSSHVSTADGGNASATAIRAMIRRLIAAENPAKPISDSKLANTLRDDAGIKVARRTVAKYREEMDIAPSHQRRRKPS